MFYPGTKLTRPIKILVAVDGKYEEALQLHPSYSDYSKDDIEKLLSTFKRNVSIEFFYETSDSRTSYFGIKYKPDSIPSMSSQEFVYRSLDTFTQNQSFDSFVPAIGKALSNDEEAFLSTKPNRVELGVNEWWFTFGPLVIWQDGDPVLAKESLTDKLESREDLCKNPKNFVGAEVIFMSPIEHWLSTQVSELTQGGYILNLDQVLAITNLI